MKAKQQSREVKHMDQVVFVDAEGARHVANVARVWSNTMLNVLYQTSDGVKTAASVPHRSVNATGSYFIHPDEEEAK
ncbi:MAG: hypothetical protein AVDCRST_MAG86-2166 [uncultured Truepera sp.]|uniref:Uncharacterized protein n=1 Tax=uncultured Truepera sp. TaxID=543023 RepID=A0A6J4VD55_9DEIN|nr:MAG: hypothetical protein AVDCRST_MAG86-2166 [uncultured Truepera sp.]